MIEKVLGPQWSQNFIESEKCYALHKFVLVKSLLIIRTCKNETQHYGKTYPKNNLRLYKHPSLKTSILISKSRGRMKSELLERMSETRARSVSRVEVSFERHGFSKVFHFSTFEVRDVTRRNREDERMFEGKFWLKDWVTEGTSLTRADFCQRVSRKIERVVKKLARWNCIVRDLHFPNTIPGLFFSSSTVIRPVSSRFSSWKTEKLTRMCVCICKFLSKEKRIDKK